MTSSRPEREVSGAKRLVFGLVLLLMVYGAIEVIALVAYRPLVGSTFGEVGDELDRMAPDVKAGREKAGLGFQDPNMSLHPYLGYVFTPKDDDAEEGTFHIPVSEDGFLDENGALRHRQEGRFIVGLMGGSVSGQMGTFHGEHLRRALARHPDLAGRELDFVWLGMPGYHQPQQVLQLGWLLAQGGRAGPAHQPGRVQRDRRSRRAQRAAGSPPSLPDELEHGGAGHARSGSAAGCSGPSTSWRRSGDGAPRSSGTPSSRGRPPSS